MNAARNAQKNDSQRRISRRDVLRGGIAVSAIMATERTAFGGAFAKTSAQKPGTHPSVALLCEWLSEPLGIQNSHPRLSWSFSLVNEGLRQTAYQIVAGSTPDVMSDLWDSGKVDSSDVSALYQGSLLSVHQQAYWRVRAWLTDGTVSPWSQTARWSMGPQTEHDWGASRWIGRDNQLESAQEQIPGVSKALKDPAFLPAPYLRKEFPVRGAVRTALLYVCGLGYAELHLNGQKVGDTERDPGFTNYNDRVLYVTHDITRVLRQGSNVLGAILGTGWYDVHDLATWHFERASWRRRPRMRLQLVLSYRDGRTETVVSDESWRCSSGPILRDGIYTGEVYDARKELPGWSTSGFDCSAWTSAMIVEPPAGKLVPLTCEPIRITQDLKPVSIKQPRPGIYIVDMGQNFSGHVQLRVKGPAGQAITMRYGETLDDDGMLYTEPIDHLMEPTAPRQPFQQDTYILKGSGEEEVWEQRFSYSGFRYVEVRGFPGVPAVNNFLGRFAHTDLKSAGSFSCSDETMNRIQHATIWSYLSNAQSYPTDCPQREKNGWTGDAGLAVECGLINFHSASFYRKWLDDFADVQQENGAFPVIVPTCGWGYGELTPPWDAAYLIVVWNLYRYTGDRRILERHIAPARRYVEFFLAHRNRDGLAPALGIGDWAPWETETPQDYVTNSYLYYDLTLLSKILNALEDAKSAQHYNELAAEMAATIHQKYYDPVRRQYSNGSQTAQSIALHFGIVPESVRDAVFASLEQHVEQLGHIDTGILGAKFLLHALSQGGRTDLAFQLVTRKQVPGWGYWVNGEGATTLWEHWKRDTVASMNHIMFGDVSAWAYQWLAGIQQEPASTGYDKILFRPGLVAGLTSVSASYAAPRGRISSQWVVEGKHMHLSVEVPCGADARLELPRGCQLAKPGADAETLLPSGRHEIEVLIA